VRGDEDRNTTAGPLPTLFVGVGSAAGQALAELSHLAKSLTLPIQGPFGLALADAGGEDLFTCDWTWASDFRMPEPGVIRERSEFIGAEDPRLVAVLSALVRRLRCVEPGADWTAGSHIRMSAYVIVDLSEAAAVTSAIRLMRVLREVDAAVDTTVLSLTARTAATSSADDGRWFETWTHLLEQLQDGLCAQRVYLLDGCDAEKVWLERPEQLHRLAAEFLLHGGLTCRGLLKPHERARTGAQESLLHVCGSFGCRTLGADPAVVAERVAERLAREDLVDLYERTVPSGWLTSIQEQARALVDRIEMICERASQGRSAGDGRDRHGASWSENAEIAEVVSKTIRHVCSREPLISLCLFFQLLRPRLARLLTQQRLRERTRIRHMVGEIFRRQEENTYGPLRLWLAQPQAGWADRFTPVLRETGNVAVSRPARRKNYFIGGLLLSLGLAGVAVGTFSDARFLAAGSGLLALAAGVLMTLPTGWAFHPRNRLREGQQQSPVREVPYRMGSDRRTRLGGTTLIVAGLVGVTCPLWLQVATLAMGIKAAGLVVIGGVGLACAGWGLSGRRTVGQPEDRTLGRLDRVRDEEAPGHVNPPAWQYVIPGLLGLGLAWSSACLAVPAWPASTAVVPRAVHLVGLFFVAAGAGWVLFPRVGYASLVAHIARMPQPLAGGIARPIREGELPGAVLALAAWVNRLAVDPEQCLERMAAANAPPADRRTVGRSDSRTGRPSGGGRETLLDFLAADWEGQLAQAFRQTIEARAGKSLKILAQQPGVWAQCIAAELKEPHTACGELTSLFAVQAVKAWIESLSLAQLLSFLTIDTGRFHRMVGRVACAHWPAPRVEPDVSVNVVAVGQPLWDTVAPLAGIEGGPLIVPLDWDTRRDVVLVLRVVQGLAQGWRGFPGLPGQIRASSRTAVVPA